MGNNLCFGRYQLTSSTHKSKKNSRIIKKSTEPFLWGKIDAWWLTLAHEKSKAALAVGICLWHRKALVKSLEFSVSLKTLSTFLSLSRSHALKGIRDLEEAGLIKVFRASGRKSIYLIITEKPNISGPK